ncbi:hypothetical protein E2C01_026682 [Portunus trituberculatus]|uniref:Uncharacterized protein n=1 Tax=Portunus trituberculatus TaxID=210409 RepID=A0A5B7EJG4_PORTR|nr:hypothetical protein [Portunus trituberculatus]
MCEAAQQVGSNAIIQPYMSLLQQALHIIKYEIFLQKSTSTKDTFAFPAILDKASVKVGHCKGILVTTKGATKRQANMSLGKGWRLRKCVVAALSCSSTHWSTMVRVYAHSVSSHLSQASSMAGRWPHSAP